MDSDRRRKPIEENRGIYKSVRRILLRIDPVGIYVPVTRNTGEYDVEISRIVPKLKECRSEDGVFNVVYSEFEGWTSNEAGIKAACKEASKEIWEALKKSSP